MNTLGQANFVILLLHSYRQVVLPWLRASLLCFYFYLRSICFTAVFLLSSCFSLLEYSDFNLDCLLDYVLLEYIKL